MVLYAGRPLGVARTQHRRTDRPGGAQVLDRIGVDAEPVHAHTEHLGHLGVTRGHEAEGADRTVLGDQRESSLVGRFGDPGPRGSGSALGPAHGAEG
jgi:hypothetical protein